MFTIELLLWSKGAISISIFKNNRTGSLKESVDVISGFFRFFIWK